MNALELIGAVASERIQKTMESSRGGRVVYAIVDLPPSVTCAIGLAAHSLGNDGSVVVAIHPQCAAAVDGFDQSLISSDVATHYRNNKKGAVRATIFSIPSSELNLVIPSMKNVQRIDRAWLLDRKKMEIWARHVLGADSTSISSLGKILRGLIDSDNHVSVEMFANFLVSIEEGWHGSKRMSIPDAINNALPCLHLPRDMLDVQGKAEKLVKNAESLFRAAFEQTRNDLYLKSKAGDFKSSRSLRARIDEMRNDDQISQRAAAALHRLVADHGLLAGTWSEAQRALVEIPWNEVRPFFDETTKKARPKLGEETVAFFNANYSGVLLNSEKDTILEIRTESSTPNPEHVAFFTEHAERLKKEPKLYRRWQRFVFDKPIETADLTVGLVQLVAGAAMKSQEGNGQIADPVAYVRLRGGDALPFWTSEKNTDLCRFLRDRFRGLEDLLRDVARLDFGRCWTSDWESQIGEEKQTSTSRNYGDFQFEAYVVPRSLLAKIGKDDLKAVELAAKLKQYPKAQMTWNPGMKSLVSSYSDDIARLLKNGSAFLLSGSVTSAPQGANRVVENIDISDIGTLSDSRRESRGALVNPDITEARIDLSWPDELARQKSEHIITDEEHARILNAFEEFHQCYSQAIRALGEQKGEGLADEHLVLQAERYGALLKAVRENARSEEGVANLWEPLLRIGAVVVDGPRPGMIVTPWHPLRLAEIAAKARQASDVIGRIMKSYIAPKPAMIDDYVKDRLEAIEMTYYADVGVVQKEEKRTILIESSRVADYSLLEPPYFDDPSVLGGEPVRDTVRVFGEIAEKYLDLRPHERASFSVAILDAESEDLPIVMANHLSRQIEDDADLRCDLVVTHDDIAKLRSIYERQNRRIVHEIDSYQTGETARSFLSRLRVGIVSPKGNSGTIVGKAHDIVLLKDVIAKKARVTWAIADSLANQSLATHTPTDVSRRRPYSVGARTSAVYLTSPMQPECGQAFLDVVHDVSLGRPDGTLSHYLPIQEVDFASASVGEKLTRAHALGTWVINYDRIADRRLIASSGTLRILRYHSSPRSIHNVIVSTELSQQYLGERLKEDLSDILPGSDDAVLAALMQAIHKSSASLSGGIIMRGAQLENSAKELISVVVAQRQLDLFLSGLGEHKTAWFFLDEFRGWLDITGEIADVMAVSLLQTVSGPRVVITLIEVKCVAENGNEVHRSKSLRQLESTYEAMISRFFCDDSLVDSRIWRGRLADMILEHIDPFNRVGDLDCASWLRGIRVGTLAIEMAAHSIVFLHDMTVTTDFAPSIPDLSRSQGERRRLAQWTFGGDVMAATLRDFNNPNARVFIQTPREWPRALEPESALESRDGAFGSGSAGEIGLATAPSCAASVPAGDLQPQGVDDSEPVPVGDLKDKAHAAESGSCPDAWKKEIFDAVHSMLPPNEVDADEAWLEDAVARLQSAIQKEGMSAPVVSHRLTPTTGLIYLDGRSLSVAWLEKRQTDILTRYSIEIERINPMAGKIAVAIKRPNRVNLHLSTAWLRREFEPTSPSSNLALLIGEREEDGGLLYLPLSGPFGDQEKAAPHSVISGNTGSGKGILVSNLILDICAFNSPNSVDIVLIDPAGGADYAWVKVLPHMHGEIITKKEDAKARLRQLVDEMDRRLDILGKAGLPNIDEYNEAHPAAPLPKILVFFDEVPKWMVDDDFRKEVDSLFDEVAAASRKAGFHLFMIYQRADNQVMTMQLRTNLGNKLVLRLSDEGSSKIIMNEKGAERLMGKGQLIAKLDSDQKIYVQVPFITTAQIRHLANVIASAWRGDAERNRSDTNPLAQGALA